MSTTTCEPQDIPTQAAAAGGHDGEKNNNNNNNNDGDDRKKRPIHRGSGRIRREELKYECLKCGQNHKDHFNFVDCTNECQYCHKRHTGICREGSKQYRRYGQWCMPNNLESRQRDREATRARQTTQQQQRQQQPQQQQQQQQYGAENQRNWPQAERGGLHDLQAQLEERDRTIRSLQEERDRLVRTIREEVDQAYEEGVIQGRADGDMEGMIRGVEMAQRMAGQATSASAAPRSYYDRQPRPPLYQHQAPMRPGRTNNPQQGYSQPHYNTGYPTSGPSTYHTGQQSMYPSAAFSVNNQQQGPYPQQPSNQHNQPQFGVPPPEPQPGPQGPPSQSG